MWLPSIDHRQYELEHGSRKATEHHTGDFCGRIVIANFAHDSLQFDGLLLDLLSRLNTVRLRRAPRLRPLLSFQPRLFAARFSRSHCHPMRLGLSFAIWLVVAVGARVILRTSSNHVAVISAGVKFVNLCVDSDPVLRVLAVVLLRIVILCMVKIIKPVEAKKWNDYAKSSLKLVSFRGQH